VSADTAGLLVAAIAGTGLRTIVEARARTRIRALHDTDTELPNSLALLAALEEEHQDSGITVVSASIDRFETIRAALGVTGVAKLVGNAAERLAVASGARIFRIAPDTLSWLSRAPDEAASVVDACRTLFLQPFSSRQGPVDVNLTFGLAVASDAAARGSLVEQSLAAVSSARSSGESSGWFKGIAAETVRDLSIIGRLRRGISDGDVFVAYQPKLDLKTGMVTHAEALVRWRDPVRGLIPPDRFLPLAEETGAVRELTRFVLRRVLSECSAPCAAVSQLGVSVNVSAADIADPAFADEIMAALAQSRIDPSRLTLEITESAIIGSHETALKVLQELRRRLVQLSIDDYGTGQSTLTYLKKLPVDELKIDKSFVTSIASNAGDRIMVRSTIGMAHELGVRVVAEGVEDWDAVSLLRKLDCDYVQGFCIGGAMSFDALCALAEQSFLRKVA
jgi:EAL domain-containing protein (putative c-di-GMP-specific phosphodiesterase class I)/GGDEF domain-containing protein